MHEPGEITEAGPGLTQRVRQLELATDRLSALLEMGRILSSETSLDRLLTLVMEQTTRVLGVERSSLFLVDHERGELWSKVAQGMADVEIRFPLGRGIAGHVALTGEVVNLEDAYRDPRFNPAIDRITGFRTRSLLALPLKRRDGKVLGVVQALNKRSGPAFTAEDVDIFSALGAQAAISIENALLYERIESLFEAFVTTIVAAIDARDPTTAGHSQRVAEYAVNLARSLPRSDDPDMALRSFSREELRALRYAAILHDVGKIGVREQVLCKRYTLFSPELAMVEERIRRARIEADIRVLRAGAGGAAELEFYDRLLATVARRRVPGEVLPADHDLLRRAHDLGLLTGRQFECLTLRESNLSPNEWEDMKSHAARSYDLLVQIPWPEPLRRIPEIAGSHHEKLDGSGYPGGLRRDEYPFESQLVCVSDIYDALTASDRPYKSAYTRTEARRILEEEARAERIDARLVRIFFASACYELPPDAPRPSPFPPPEPAL